MDSRSNLVNNEDSVTLLREYVRDYKMQRGEAMVEVEVDVDDDILDNTGKSEDLKKDANTSNNEANSTNDVVTITAPLSVSKSNPKSNTQSLSGAAKQFMDNTSLSSSSTLSDIHDYDDDYISYSDGRRPSFFIESSRVSMSSDDEDPLPNLIEFILADRDRPQGEEAIYNDWDSGLSHSSIEFNGDDNVNDDVSWTDNSNTTPPDILESVIDIPHRALRFMECQICLEMAYLRRRVCCDFQICNKCILMYLTGKVTEGKVQIECANDRCNALMHKEEIRYRLPIEIREKFVKFLIDANKDPYVKTCPSCSLPFEIDPARLNINKKKLKQGVKVMCTQCRLVWCFCCQAPFHTDMTCKKYRNEDRMVKRWAKEKSYGQVNAQKCPKCKVFVQKTDGCDHMKCSRCETSFCYKCGDRYISVKFFGSHWNRFSLFGCKYRLMPEKNGLRRFIRGSHFVGRVLAAIIFAGLGVAAGAVLIAGSVVILPGYGIVRLRRRMWAAKQRKKFNRVKMRMINTAELQQALREKQAGNLETVVEESETETVEHVPDPQQIQVIVHHPEEDVLTLEEGHQECDIFINKYAGEDSDVTISRFISRENEEVVLASEDSIISHSDFKEISSEEKYTKLVLDVLSSVKKEEEEEEIMVDTMDSGICDDDALENEESRALEKKADDARSDTEMEDIGKVDGDEKTIDYSDLKSLQQGLICNDDHEEMVLKSNKLTQGDTEQNTEHICISDAQNTNSLSKGKTTNLGEKIIVMKTKVLKDSDKTYGSEKVDGENGGKGCFGNIFNVGKRTTVVPPPVHSNNSSNEEEIIVKSNKENISSLHMKKAATWEKCRRSKVELDSTWVKSSTDPSHNDSKNFPLIVHKSSSSFSSIMDFNFNSGANDVIDKKRETVDYLCDCSHTVIPGMKFNSNTEEDCHEKCMKKDNDSDTGSFSDDDDNFDLEAINKIELEITDADRSHNLPYIHDSEYISQVNIVTHL